jgi:hypothetical protein
MVLLSEAAFQPQFIAKPASAATAFAFLPGAGAG